MVLDLTLVIIVTILFSAVTIFIKNEKSFSSILKNISQNVILSGSFISVIQLIIAISKYEQMIIKNETFKEYVSIFTFLITIFIKFRPLLFGIAIKLIFMIFSKRTDFKQAQKDAKESFKSDKYEILSPREKEVARLAAHNYSNAQIADELFISTETVKRHLSTIFEKLKISSRKELE